MKVHVVRDGKAYEEEFKNGGHPIGTLRCLGATKEKTGTTITFAGPDDFSTTKYNYETIQERIRNRPSCLKESSCLTDERTPNHHDVFQYDDGLKVSVSPQRRQGDDRQGLLL